MAWCRWSTDIDKKTTSDLYIFDDVYGGVTVHVAGRKRHAIVPDEQIPEMVPSIVGMDVGEWKVLYDAHWDWWGEHNEGKHWEWRPVVESWAGKSMNFTDMGAMKVALDEMRADGVTFPDYVYDYIKDTQHDLVQSLEESRMRAISDGEDN